MKVLIATDGSDAAVDGAQRALELLQPGIEVMLTVVIPEREDPLETATGFAGPLITEEEAEEEHSQALEHGRRALERTIHALNRSHLTEGDTLETRLLTSNEDAGDTIVAEAGRCGAELVIIGASGRGFWGRLFGKSVSEKVARDAPCPVLIVPRGSMGD